MLCSKNLILNKSVLLLFYSSTLWNPSIHWKLKKITMQTFEMIKQTYFFLGKQCSYEYQWKVALLLSIKSNRLAIHWPLHCYRQYSDAFQKNTCARTSSSSRKITGKSSNLMLQPSERLGKALFLLHAFKQSLAFSTTFWGISGNGTSR